MQLNGCPFIPFSTTGQKFSTTSGPTEVLFLYSSIHSHDSARLKCFSSRIQVGLTRGNSHRLNYDDTTLYACGFVPFRDILRPTLYQWKKKDSNCNERNAKCLQKLISPISSFCWNAAMRPISRRCFSVQLKTDATSANPYKFCTFPRLTKGK